MRDLEYRFVILGPGQNISVARLFFFPNRIFLSGPENYDSYFLRIVFLGPGQNTAAPQIPLKIFAPRFPPPLRLFHFIVSIAPPLRGNIVLSSLFIEQKSARP